MAIHVIGAGAMGLWISSKLLAIGHPVTLWTRTVEQQKELLHHGLVVQFTGTQHTYQFNTCEVYGGDSWKQPSEDSALSPVDPLEPTFYLLTVKQTHLNDAMMSQLHDRLSRDHTYLVCFQNGIGHAEKLSKYVSSEKLVLAVTTEAALRVNGHTVAHTGQGTTWLAGCSEESIPAQKKLEQTLSNAGLSMSLSKDITDVIWKKLLLNAVINPLTALLNIRNGELLERPERIELMRALFREAYPIALFANPQLPSHDELWSLLLEVCSATARNQSSMLQDRLAGNMTEIEAINGVLVQSASLAGLQTPVHEAILVLVRAAEEK